MNTTTKTPAKTPAQPTPPPSEAQSSSLQLPPSEERKKRRSWLTLLAGSLGILLVGFLVMGLVANRESPMETAEEQKPNSTTPEDSLKKPWYHPIAETVRKWTTKQSVLPANLITKRVAPGRFRITINEKGFLNSQRNETLTSLVPGATTIISIVPEGTYVQEGDIVCELDSSALEEKARQQEIDVTKAEASFSAAKENLEIQKNQNDSDIAIAALTLELAKLDLQKYLEGELPQQQDSIDGQIRLKQEELARKRESYEFIKRMAKKGYRSLSDLEAERIAVTKAEIELKVETVNLHVLQNFTSKRDIAQLEADATELVRELERTKRKADAALSKAQAEYEASRLTLQVEREKYQEWLKRIQNCKLKAPQSGEVVYANQNSQGRRGGSTDPDIYEGATVRERQAIINIPDNSRMKIDARIHESMISKLRVGLPVNIRADARPGEVFEGVVSEISSVPLSEQWPNFDVKEYQVGINLTDPPEKVSTLRSGLSADFEVVVDDRENILQAPVQSIVQVGRNYYTWVVSNNKINRRQLKIGFSNETDVEIVDGVNAGEIVVMNPRSQFSEEISKLAEQAAGAENQDRAARGQGRPEMALGGPAGRGGPGGGQAPVGEAAPGATEGTEGAAPPQRGPRPEGDRPGPGGPRGDRPQRQPAPAAGA